MGYRRSWRKWPKRLKTRTFPMTSRKWARLRNRRKRNPTPPSKRASANTAPNATNCCVHNTAKLAGTARKRDLLLDLVADYHAAKTRPQHGRIQRLHHRRIPTRHPIPLHRSHLPQTLHARAARRIPRHLHHAGGPPDRTVPRRFHPSQRGERRRRPLPIDLRMARSQPRRIPHAATRLRPRRHRQALHADRHPT